MRPWDWGRETVSRRGPGDDLRLLYKVSALYYDQGLTQSEIGDRLTLSRSKVSRLIQQAHDRGIVRITIMPPTGLHLDLEHQLERRFQLREAVVVDVPDPISWAGVGRQIGVAAAEYFQRTLRDGDVIGVSWGVMLNAMVEAMHPQQTQNVTVVQILGRLGYHEEDTHSSDLCRRMARLLGAKCVPLPAPCIADTEQVRQAILSDSHVQKVMDLIPRLDTVCVSAHVPEHTFAIIRDSSAMTQAEIDDLMDRNVAGDIVLHFFDAQGQPIGCQLDRRVIGISLDQLKQVGRVIGVSGGPDKVVSLRAALVGGYITVLITDQYTASALLQ
jgi:DNA-binding transcriptional regulator LsrR (DeoR family)